MPPGEPCSCALMPMQAVLAMQCSEVGGARDSSTDRLHGAPCSLL